MNFNKKDVLTGFVLLILIASGVYFYKNYNNSKKQDLSTPPVSYEFKKDFEDNFKITFPEGKNVKELKDVSGGNSRAVATENEILLDADELNNNFYYQGWMEKKDGTLVSLGKFDVAKGGFLLNYKGLDNESYKLIVSLETNNDNKIEKKILEGSF